VLDLDGNGIQTLAANQGVNFDLFGDGQSAQWGWVAGNDGFLVMDRNGDGQINDGKELFGSGTRLADGSRAADGYAAMAAEDSNKDGKLDASDANFGKLQVWVDADKDGFTDAGELKGLADLGIVSLDLNAAKGSEIDNGNLLGLTSSYTKSDGTKGEMADVWFAKDQTPPPLGELVAPAAEAVPLPGHQPSDAAPPAGAGGVPPASVQLPMPLRGLDEDETYRPPLL
jgi:hypothetical protein